MTQRSLNLAEAAEDANAEVMFVPEDDEHHAGSRSVWRILAVDDDRSFQRATALALKNTIIFGRRLEVVQAYSLAEAARQLAQDRDFAVILVDVVMECEDAGLRLAKGVRETLGLMEPRIVLLTGQPGFAPVARVMEDYDLTDYCIKSDLARRSLNQVLTGAIRAYRQLHDLVSARKGLQLIIESSGRLAAARSIDELARKALAETARLLDVPVSGLVCEGARMPAEANAFANLDARQPVITCAEGSYADVHGRALSALDDHAVEQTIRQALAGHISIDTAQGQAIFLPREEARSDYVVYLRTGRPLEPAEKELLGVFATNLSRGFGNVALIDRLDRLAFEDPVLRMPNATALLREIDRLRRPDGEVGRLVLFDVDQFSRQADGLGDGFRNALLTAVARRLESAFPPPAMVARIADDLFGIVGPATLVNLDRAAGVLATPLEIEGAHHWCSACAAEIPLDTPHADARALKRAALQTLRIAKSRGSGHGMRWSPEFERDEARRFRIHARLTDAIAQGGFHVKFQPQFDLDCGRLIGAEALLRWHSPDGPVPPDEFIPIAEKSAHIHAIGRYVIEQACDAIGELEAAGIADIVVSVNVSARQFEQDGLTEAIREICHGRGVRLDRLGIELTETAVMSSFDRVVEVLRAHRDAGGKVAIDDFGTGMASLEYLHMLPADFLKIDRTFVSSLDHEERGRSIARMIIELGHSLGVSLIAEGVETREQAEWLRRHGCRFAQGWLLGRPLSLPQLIALARDRRGLP